MPDPVASTITIDRASLESFFTSFIDAGRAVIAAGDQAVKSKAAMDAAVRQSIADNAASAAAHDILDRVIDEIEEFKQAGYVASSASAPIVAETPAGTVPGNGVPAVNSN